MSYSFLFSPTVSTCLILVGNQYILNQITNCFINSSEQTGLWTELEKIENNFLKPLHTGLNMSKAHYEAEIKNSQGW